jgi:acyl-coenzyme A thioesterase PaaI-like protein
MPTTDALLRAAVSRADDDAVLVTLDPVFQGLPDTAHGGTLLALFDALAERPTPRRVSAHYRRRVPLGTPLPLAVAHETDAVAYRLREPTGAVLVDGRVEEGPAGGAASPRPVAGSSPLPVSRTCFACGVDNPAGLRARLGADDVAVTGEWIPSPAFVDARGALAPVALTTLLDEAAFWLGALASGESGMTTELRVTLHGPAAATALVRVAGERAAVRPRAEDARYWDTRIVAADADGRLLATAEITFVAIRGAARRLVSGLLGLNPPDVVRRVFPAYAG